MPSTCVVFQTCFDCFCKFKLKENILYEGWYEAEGDARKDTAIYSLAVLISTLLTMLLVWLEN